MRVLRSSAVYAAAAFMRERCLTAVVIVAEERNHMMLRLFERAMPAYAARMLRARYFYAATATLRRGAVQA